VITYLFSMANRILGYAVILFLIIFLLVPGAYFSVRLLAPVHHRTIVFEDVSTLNFLHIEDPVKVRGVPVGVVRALTWKDNKTYVKIETKSELPIHQGYRIMAEDKGLMGDRYVAIWPGDAGRPVIDKKEILTGRYLMGLAEAIAYVENLDRMVDTVTAIVGRLRQGSASDPSLITRFNDIMRQLDQTTVVLAGVLAKTDRAVEKAGDSLARFVEKIGALSDSLGSAVPDMVASTESIIAKAVKLLEDVDSLAQSSGALVSRLNSAEARALDEKCRTLRNQLRALREAVDDLQKHGLRLPVKIK
jgi:ABC-type transporter Mla subunit MlaD